MALESVVRQIGEHDFVGEEQRCCEEDENVARNEEDLSSVEIVHCPGCLDQLQMNLSTLTKTLNYLFSIVQTSSE